MRTTKLLVLAVAAAVSPMIGSAVIGTGMIATAVADSAAVTNYKQAVTSRVEAWGTRMAKLSADLTQAKTDLAVLNVQTPRPADIDAQIKDKQNKINGIQQAMTYETNSLRIDLAAITVTPPDKSEALPLPGFISDIIKAKGLPLSKNVSFAPNISWNFKSGTLGSASGTINIMFQ
jgi:hypothetical protein